MSVADFELIEVGNVDSDGQLIRLVESEPEVGPLENSSDYGFTNFEWWVRTKTGDIHFFGKDSRPQASPRLPGMESFTYLPAGMVAVGLGARSTDDSFSNSGILGQSMNADFSLGNRDSWIKHNASTLEVQSFVIGTVQKRVVVGVGHRVSRGDVKGIWLYTAPYDRSTRMLKIDSPSDITIYVYRTGPEADLIPEVEFRSWDVYKEMSRVRKTFIVGYGGGTHKSDATRVGLRFTQLCPRTGPRDGGRHPLPTDIFC